MTKQVQKKLALKVAILGPSGAVVAMLNLMSEASESVKRTLQRHLLIDGTMPAYEIVEIEEIVDEPKSQYTS